MDVEFIHDPFLYFVQYVQDFLACGVAVVDYEVRVLGGYLGIADGEADEAIL